MSKKRMDKRTRKAARMVTDAKRAKLAANLVLDGSEVRSSGSLSSSMAPSVLGGKAPLFQAKWAARKPVKRIVLSRTLRDMPRRVSLAE